MDEEYVDNQDPYNEQAREEQLENEEMNSAEEGFLKGYEQEVEDEVDNGLEEDERLED